MKTFRNLAIGALAVALFAGGFAFRGSVSGGQEQQDAAPKAAEVKPPVAAKLPRPETRDPGTDGTASGSADFPSPGLLALREAFLAKDSWKMHKNIQKFEAGEFDEVWGLLLSLPNGRWKTQEMELAVAKASNLGLLDEALERILADIPPGTGREPLLKQVFSARKQELLVFVAKAQAFTDFGERKAVFDGISDRISGSVG